MKKKDKVTLKGVDKPEPFQHWTEDQVLSTANSCKEFLGDIDYATLTQASYDGKAIYSEYDELTGKIFHTAIDPYHIEPIDNPQKPIGQETSRLSVTVKNSEIKPIYGNILNAMVLDQLKSIKKDHPEVLEQFIKEHYGK